MKKVSLKIILILTILLVLLPGSGYCTIYSGTCGRVNAYPQVDSTNLLWNVNTVTRKLTITGSGMMRDYDMDTPAPWHQYRDDFDVIRLSDSATCIGEYAFWDLTADSIHIGSAVESVHRYAFQSSSFQSLVFPAATRIIELEGVAYCQRLKRAIFGGGVESIGYYAFYSCDSLQLVDMGASDAVLGAYSFAYCGQLTTFVCTQIRHIDYYAFCGDASLCNLSLGDSLTYIGHYAFWGCSSLTRFVLPAATTAMGENPFAFCGALDTISVSSGNTEFDSRNNCNAIIATGSNAIVTGCARTVIPTSCVAIGAYAFSGQYRITSISIPDNIRSIGNSAFEGCSALLNVNLSDSVTEVGCMAFLSCPSLQSPIYNSHLFARLPETYSGIYTMPAGIQQITCGAFSYSFHLTSVVMPQSLRAIGGNAFEKCTMLDTITIPSKVNRLDPWLFQECEMLSRVTLPDSINNIALGLFYHCSNLRSIVIPDLVSNIEDYAFDYCSRLQHVALPANLGSIGNPFVGCDSLSSIVWNAKDCRWSDWHLTYYPVDDVLTYGYYSNTAFYPIRHNVTSFVFGDSVRVIPPFLCYEMDNLTQLTLPANIDSIGRYAFAHCNNASTIYWNPRRCNNPASYIHSPFYTFKDNVTNFTFGDSVRDIPAYLCHGMSNLHQLHIPALVSNIGPYAFRYLNQLDTIWVDSANTSYDSRNHCNALMHTQSDSLLVGCWKSVIPSDTRSIAPYAFRNVSRLTHVVVPEGVSYIGREAFNGCEDIDSLTLPTRLAHIQDYTFQDCRNMRYLRMPDSLLTVGLRAFANCRSLPTLNLASTLTFIDDYAFSNCSGLLDIYCNPTTPPAITSSSFTGSSCPIYVPCAELYDYRDAPVWSGISSRINGQFYLTFDARPNDYSFGDVIIRQEPNCMISAIVEARPVPGYEFVEWTNQRGETMSTDALFEFEPEEDLVLTAVFQRLADPEYNITLVAIPDNPAHGATRIVIQPNYGIPAEISAIPVSGYAFVAWVTVDGDTLSRQSDYTFDPQLVYNDNRDTVVVIAVFDINNGISDVADGHSLKVWTDQKNVFVSTPDHDTYDLYNINGQKVNSARGSEGSVLKMGVPSSGFYIVKSRRYCVKVVVK